MSRPLLIGLAFIAILVIGLVTAAGIFVYTADYNRYKGLIEKVVMDATGRQLAIKGDLAIAMSLPLEIAVADVTLANAAWGSRPQMARVGQLRVRLRILPLLKGDVEIIRIKLIDTDLLLETDASGQANWRFSHKASSRTGVGIRDVAVEHLEVERLAVTSRSGKTASPAAHYQLDSLKLSRSAAADALAVELKGSSNGQPVALSGHTGTLGALFSGKRFPLMLAGDVAGATLKLHGGLANASALEGLDLTVGATGTDLATLGKVLAVTIPQTDKFDVTAQLTGSGEKLALREARGSASYKGIELLLNGEIGDLRKLDDIQFALEGSGNDLAELSTFVGKTLPQTGPFEVSGKLTGSASTLALSEAQGTISHASIKLSLAGEIGDLIAAEDIDLHLKGSGNDLAELSTFVGKTLPQTGPFEVSGKLTGSASTLALSEAQGTISHASIKLSLAGRIVDLIALEGIDLNLKGSGSDLAELSSVVDQTLPQTGPFEVSGKLTGSASTLVLSEAQGTISHASIKLSLAGRIVDLIALEGIDLHLKGSGNDLAELSTFVDQTLPQTGPFEVSGKLTGSATVLTLSEAHGTIGRQSIQVALAGRIGNLMTLKGISLDVKGSGKSLGELRSLAGDKLPDTGPFSATARLTGSAEVLAVTKLRATVNQGNAQLAVSGTVADVMKLTGIDLAVKGSGKDLGELGPLFDTQLPDLGPFRINGQLSGSDQGLELKNFAARVDQSDFAGWTKVEFGKRPRVTVRLESSLVDFTRIMDQARGGKQAEASQAETGKAGGSRRVLFSDEPLPFDLLDAVDAEIAFNARNLKARDAALEFGQLALRLESGDLRVDKLEATYQDAKVSAGLNVTTGSPADVAIRFLVQGFDLGRFLKETRVSQDVEGQVDLAADLKSRGNSLHQLMANLDGTTGAVIGKGYVPRFLDLLAQDLSRRVITIWGRHKKAGHLNCGVIQFTNKQGIATSDAFLFDTQLAILKGDGEINLATEQLDFVLSPKPKDSSLFSLATKLRVDGSIVDPRVRPDVTSVAIKGVRALSSFVLGPAGLLMPFIRAGARHQHPCDVAELKNRIHSIYQ